MSKYDFVLHRGMGEVGTEFLPCYKWLYRCTLTKPVSYYTVLRHARDQTMILFYTATAILKTSQPYHLKMFV